MIDADFTIDAMLPRLDYAAGGGGAVPAPGGDPPEGVSRHLGDFYSPAHGQVNAVQVGRKVGVVPSSHNFLRDIEKPSTAFLPKAQTGPIIKMPFSGPLHDQGLARMKRAGLDAREMHEWNGVEGFAPRPYTHLLSWVDPATGQTQAEHFPHYNAAQRRKEGVENTDYGFGGGVQFANLNPTGAAISSVFPEGVFRGERHVVNEHGRTQGLFADVVAHNLYPEHETPPAPLLPHEHLKEHMQAAGDQADPNQFLTDLGIPRQLHDALLEKWTAGGHLGETPQADWRPNEVTGEDYYTYARPTFPLIYADETIDAMLAGTNGHAPAAYAAEVKPPARPLILEEPAAPEPDRGTEKAIDRLASMLGKWAPRLLPQDRRDGRKRRFVYDDGTGCTVTEKVGEDGTRTFAVTYDDGTEATATEEATDAGRVLRFKTAKGTTCTLEAAGAGGSRTLTFRHGDGTETTMTEG